ncbi:MAG: DEAD/DEAH box helicase [Vicinamibacterales bacterium]
MRSPERPASLSLALQNDFSRTTREKGEDYFYNGAVASIAGTRDEVTATVWGTRAYQVKIEREKEGFIGSCECPYFQDRFEVCKHIWAVVLAADNRGFLQPIDANTWIEPVDENRVASADEVEPPVDRERPRPVPAPPREPWEQVLAGVLGQLDAKDAQPPVARAASMQLLYVLDRESTQKGNGIAVQLLGRTRKKNGEWGKPQPAAVSTLELEHLPVPIDREILTLLLGASEPHYYDPYYTANFIRASFRLFGPLIERVLPLLAQSGRLHVRTHAGGREELTPLTWDEGPPWSFDLHVTSRQDGATDVDGILVRGDDRMPVTEPDLLLADGFLVARGRLARLDHGGAFAWLPELRRARPVHFPAETALRVVEALARSGVDPASVDESLRFDRVEAAPRPRVKVTRAGPQFRYGVARDDLQASVEFEYDGSIVPLQGGSSSFDPEKRRLVVRNKTAEHQALQRLQQLGFRRIWDREARPGHLAVNVDQFPRAVRTLVKEGWYVEADGRAFRAPRTFNVQVKSGIDWFELHGDVDFGEGRSASIAELLAALRRGDATIVLDDGTRGMVPEEWLQRYLRIASFGEAEGDHIRYRPTQAALLDALLENQSAVSIDETFARARQELKQFSGIRALDPPSSFHGTLRDYQREALGWFEFLRRFGFGGCLADDMGLGKTVMVLALLEARRQSTEDRPHSSVAVVPRSLVFNWKDEAARFTPELRVLDYTGSSRDAEAIDDHDLVLTTYGTLRRDAPQLIEHQFDYVILDEAQAVKNAATASAKAVRLLRGKHRLALSGTPIENHVGELWSLFDFLNPGLLGSSRAFKAASAAQGPVEREDLALVTQAVKPLILRRTKAQVEPELPARTEQTIHCELDAPQRRFYDDLRAHYRTTLLRRIARTGLGKSKMPVLEALLRLRQAACHPGLVDPKRLGESSAKFDVLLPQLTEVVDEGHKALVFSQFTSFLALLRERLDDDRIAYEYLDGQTRDRAERVERFNTDPDCRLFLISLKAGGLGLNLTAAEYVFLLDPWWNPAVESQAIDRAHRIGQTRHVFAYRLIAQDTVEEKVAELQQSKREVADAILTADPALIRNLSAEDLEWLLS